MTKKINNKTDLDLKTIKYFKIFYNQSSSPTILLNNKNNILELNLACKELLNLKIKECFKKNIFKTKIIHSKDQTLIKKILKQNKNIVNKTPIEIKLNTKKGLKSHEMTTIFSDQNEGYTTITFRDLTKRKKNQAELIESMNKLNFLIERSNDGIIFVKEGKIKYSNQSFADIVSTPKKDLINMDFSQFFLLDNNIIEILKNHNYEKKKAIKNLAKIIKPNGEIANVEITISKSIHQKEEVSAIYLKDITRRKEMIDTLKFQATFLSNSTELAFAMDSYLNIIYTNRLAKKKI